MSLAGDAGRCTAYMMGNHVIAERIYRHDPTVMLYAPLRTVIYTDADDLAWFAIDQPSTVFASFSDPAITTVGLELDAKLASLLDALGVRRPDSGLRKGLGGAGNGRR